MKKIILLAMLTLSFQISQAQCEVEASGFGNNNTIPMYNVTGQVILTLEDTDRIRLDLGSDFMTAAGPDIRAFLVNSGGLSDNQLTNTFIANLENLEFGLVGSNSVNQNGAKTFTIDIPTGTDIQNFDKVFFYCLQFDQFWDFGTFIPFTPETCNLILSTSDNDLSAISMFPNPAEDELNITTTGQEEVMISIYNSLGSKIITYNNIDHSETLNISNLSSGIYFIEFTDETGSSNVRRLVIR